MEELRREFLQPQDTEQFNSFYNTVFGFDPPSSAEKWVVVKNGQGEIVGCLGIYRPIVVDSMAVREDYRGKGVWQKLVACEKDFKWSCGNGYHFWASRSRERALCKKLGMIPMDVKVFRKVF
jgi:hypothetical protein